MALLDDRSTALANAINSLSENSPELWELIYTLAFTRLANAETSGGGGGITQTQVKNAIVAASAEAKSLVTEFSLPPLTVADTATSEVEYSGYRFGMASVKVSGIGTSVTFRIEACNEIPTVEGNWFNADALDQDFTVTQNGYTIFNWEGLPFKYFRVKLLAIVGGSPSLKPIFRYGV